ncbi:hypothetical protein ACHQM5_023628 [Ranunculus cassubicifolius]
MRLVARICDVLAWPLITLVYPLYASIRAIEKNSLSDSKKCLTYWVICGLIMLFEMPFARLVEWIPFWPYVKLMFNFWFVVAHFEGAVYAYDHLIRPCFSVDLQTVGYWLRPKCNEFSAGNSDSFLLLAKRFVQENGSDELEKLISDKIKCEEPKLATEEKKSLHPGNNKENTDQNRVEIMAKNLVETGHKAIAATENKPTAEAKVVVPQSSNADNTQREWTCALCQVCVTSETTLQLHLQGKKHKAKEELIKKSTQTENSTKQSSGKTQKEKEISAKDNKAVDMTETKSGEVAKSYILGQPLKGWKCPVCHIYLANEEASIENHIQGKAHKANKEMEALRKQLVDINNTGYASAATFNLSHLWCEKCKLQCNSLSMLNEHLRGKKHLKD